MNCYDKGKYRKITYKDIVILLRATAGHGDILKEALTIYENK